MWPEVTLGKEHFWCSKENISLDPRDGEEKQGRGHGRACINKLGTLRRTVMTEFSFLHSENLQQIVSLQYDFIYTSVFPVVEINSGK